MSITEKLEKALINAEAKSAENQVKQTNTPPEFRARLELSNEEGGYFVSTPRPAGTIDDAVELFKDFDLDPNEWEVITVRKSRWQTFSGDWLEAARVNVKPITKVSMTDDDLAALLTDILKYKPSKITPATGPLFGIYGIGDTQYGKDAGGGTEETVRRVLRGLDEAVARHKELLKLGRPIGTVVLPQLGDCIEGHVSQGGKIMGRLDMGITRQIRIGRRVLLAWVKAFAPLCEELWIPVVPGNHDETTRALLTDPTDSWQIEIVSSVQDLCAEVPSLSHVKFFYPQPDSSTLAVDLDGFTLGMAHGHQGRDIPKWLQGQATGRTPVGSCDLLMTGHYHHFRVEQVGPRLWIQVPAMDGGSPWFRDKRGLESPTGIVSLVVGKDYDPRRDLSVLAGENR